jgi:hypothetical protein
MPWGSENAARVDVTPGVGGTVGGKAGLVPVGITMATPVMVANGIEQAARAISRRSEVNFLFWDIFFAPPFDYFDMPSLIYWMCWRLSTYHLSKYYISVVRFQMKNI